MSSLRDLARRWVGDWPAGRWIVLISLAIGTAWFLQRAVGSSDSLYAAFLKGLVADFGVMVALGFGQRFWGGDRLKQGQLSPTSAGGEFEEATEESVATLNTKMNALFADVNRRLDDLER